MINIKLIKMYLINYYLTWRKNVGFIKSGLIELGVSVMLLLDSNE